MGIVSAGAGVTLTAATAAALSQLTPERSGVGSALVQAFQKPAGPFGTAIAGSVLAAAYQAHLDLGDIPATMAASVRQSVYGGLAVADQLGSTSLTRSVQAAFASGVDMAQLVSAGIALVAALLALSLLPTTRGKASRDPSTAGARPHVDHCLGQARKAIAGQEEHLS
jgi:hypothetical protein